MFENECSGFVDSLSLKQSFQSLSKFCFYFPSINTISLQFKLLFPKACLFSAFHQLAAVADALQQLTSVWKAVAFNAFTTLYKTAVKTVS